MKNEEKTEIRTVVSARATITALERYNDKNPGKCITKLDLFPNVQRRAGWIMVDEDDPIYDTEAIAPPDDKFLHGHWKDIKLLAAQKYKKYIIPDADGIRLGSLEEWCALTVTKDMPIVAGIARSAAKRSRIAREQGATSHLITAILIGPGNDGDNENDEQPVPEPNH